MDASTDDPDLADGAALLAARFELGLCSHADVVAWADRIIARTERPPIDVIDLSLTRPGDERVPELLERLGSAARPQAVRRVFLDLQRSLQAGQISVPDTIRLLWKFLRRHPRIADDAIETFLYWADDEYDLIEQGHVDRTHADLQKDLEDELQRASGACE
ncbi:MAG TPA: hypothetical protein VEA69_04190 [Tepidisphaeraceae bacterium]|nr:hypothetical protein [Tepidisphaeraceae bacterium]